LNAAADPRERRSIGNDLASPDEEVRRLAVERAGLLPADEALKVLCEALGDASWRVRKAAIDGLADSPETWLVAEPLIRALGDGENPGRRNAALEALVRSGERVVPALLAASDSDDVDVRKLVVDSLTGIGSERSTPRLIEMLDDDDANVRGAVADALGAIGGPAATRALIATALAEDEDTLVRLGALRALARLEVPLRACQLGSALADPVLRPAACGVLGHPDDSEAAEQLLEGLRMNSRSAREAAAEVLVRLAGRGEPELLDRMREIVRARAPLVEDAIERLETAELGVRLMLIQFFGLVREPRAIEALLRAARDDALREVALGALEAYGEIAERGIDAGWSWYDPVARVLACDALARTRGSTGAGRLRSALADADPVVRATAARALGARADARSLGPLVERLRATANDPDPEAEEERDAVVAALIAVVSAGVGDESDRPATELLAECFEGASEALRLAVARVLGALGSAESAAWIQRLVQDPSPAVRRAAVLALAGLERGAERVSDSMRLALADEAAEVRRAAAVGLGEAAGVAALADLAPLIGDEDLLVRAAAIRAVGCVAERCVADAPLLESVLTLLEQALGDAPPVAMAAVEVFERLGDRVSLEPLWFAVGHPVPELVQAIARCVRKRGRKEDLPHLVPLVGHSNWAVRAEAIEGLAERRWVASTPAILRRLELEQDPFVRQVILRSLERLEG
jgi:HEAT repeat protein